MSDLRAGFGGGEDWIWGTGLGVWCWVWSFALVRCWRFVEKLRESWEKGEEPGTDQILQRSDFAGKDRALLLIN